MIQLYWTFEAIGDREAIYDYIEADNPVAALALDELFEEKSGRLVDHPTWAGPAVSPAPGNSSYTGTMCWFMT